MTADCIRITANIRRRRRLSYLQAEEKIAMAMFKTRTVVRHLVLSTVMLALNFPFRSIAALPGLTSSQRNASSPDIHQNAFPGDHPRTQESQWLSNAYDRVNEQLQNATSVRQSRNGCLSNSNEGHLSNPNEGRPYIRCVWKVLKKAERKIVKADDILQRVLEKVCPAECSFLLHL